MISKRSKRRTVQAIRGGAADFAQDGLALEGPKDNHTELDCEACISLCSSRYNATL